jgi:hypothetical protein
MAAGDRFPPAAQRGASHRRPPFYMIHTRSFLRIGDTTGVHILPQVITPAISD